MAIGDRYPAEAVWQRDPRSGLRIRQVTSAPHQHHHPFFFVPAYDRQQRWLFFVSHRTGKPQIFAEDRETGELIQLSDRPDLSEWSLIPSPDGRRVYYTAGAGAFCVDLDTMSETQLADFGGAEMRERGMVGAAMGTTALSSSGRWWAVPVKAGKTTKFVMIDTDARSSEVILERDTIGHPQFCPDDDDLILYAGPLTDRVWVTDRSGRANRRLYQRSDPQQWITHESWLPNARAVIFVDWPRGMGRIDVDNGEVAPLTTFPAWHAAADDAGRRIVCDTNFPDIGLHLIDVAAEQEHQTRFLCWSHASSRGDHWAGPFPYNDGPVSVYAPQHTHPHPRFSPDGRRIVFTSDRSGQAQVYELLLDGEADG